MGESQECRNGGVWGWFYIGGDGEIFKVSLHSWQRKANPPILWSPTPYCLPPLLQILSTPPSHVPVTSAPNPTVVSAGLFLWLNGCSRHIWCAVFLTDDMDLHILSLGTLVPERPWCVFYAIRHLIITGTLIWYHTQKHTAHSGTSTLTHPYKSIYTLPVMRSHELPLLH